MIAIMNPVIPIAHFLHTGEVAKAIEEMNSAGVSIVNSDSLLRG